jgi:phosphoglycolate phosphatase
MKLNLLFDMDGTLIDSSQGIYKSFCDACCEVNVEPPTYSEFLPLIGPPVQDIISKAYPFIDLANTLRAVQVFRQSYDNINYRHFTWYPNAIEVLHMLNQSLNLSMSVVTNKPTGPARSIVQLAGLDHIFLNTYGIDYLEHVGLGSKFPSKSSGIAFAMSQMPTGTVHNLYVGDTPSDQYASQQNSLIFIAALYGFHDWPANLEYSIKSIQELPSLVSQFFNE